ncbi:hypothetical protein COC55_06590 [Bacillus cereus]|nr:hypothetical protein COC55_06590 [Bacillus cereus]
MEIQEKKKIIDSINPPYVIGIYLLLSAVIILLKLLHADTNGYFMTTLAILSILFVVVTNWNAKYLGLIIILGIPIFVVLQFSPLSPNGISILNDILSICVFNFSILWTLAISRKQIEEKKHKDYMLTAVNGGIYQALEEHLKNEWFHDMQPHQREKFWEAIESLTYEGAPRREDYEN